MGRRVDQPTSMVARARSVVSATRIGVPFKVAPCPRRAAKVSPSAGATSTPISGVRSSSSASDTQKRGAPRMKLAVPSIGSTTQRRAPARATPPSSP